MTVDARAPKSKSKSDKRSAAKPARTGRGVPAPKPLEGVSAPPAQAAEQVQPVAPAAVPLAGAAAAVPASNEIKATPARSGAQPSPSTSALPQAPDASSRSPFTSDTTQTRRYMHRATKIVATIGPASSSPEILLQMMQAGLDVVRLNFSHGTADDHRQRAEHVREAARQTGRASRHHGRPAGPEDPRRQVRAGQDRCSSRASRSSSTRIARLGNDERVGLDYKDLPRDLKPGDVLLLNDGLIVLTVARVIGDEIHTVVKVGGELSNNKGINRQGGGLTAPALTAKDMEDIRTAMSHRGRLHRGVVPEERDRHGNGAPAREHRRRAVRQQAEDDREDRARRGDSGVARHPRCLRRHHGRARRSGCRGRQRGRAGAAKADDPDGARVEQARHHGHADDGIDDLRTGADARRSLRRGQRRARRHRRRDAVGGNGRGQIPGSDDRGDGRDLYRSGEVGARRTRQGLPRPHLHAHRPVDRHGRACSRLTISARKRSWR